MAFSRLVKERIVVEDAYCNQLVPTFYAAMNEPTNWGSLVDPETDYPVSYTIDQEGNRHEGSAMVKGKDLTENQIRELFSFGKSADEWPHDINKHPNTGYYDYD